MLEYIFLIRPVSNRLFIGRFTLEFVPRYLSFNRSEVAIVYIKRRTIFNHDKGKNHQIAIDLEILETNLTVANFIRFEIQFLRRFLKPFEYSDWIKLEHDVDLRKYTSKILMVLERNAIEVICDELSKITQKVAIDNL